MSKSFKRLFTVDPSLTCSGWALFLLSSSGDGGKLCAAGKIRCLPATESMPERLKDLQRKVDSVYHQFELNHEDLLICEAPTTMKDPRAAMQVEQVRGIFETLARSLDVTVPGRVNPRSVQYEVIGLKGKQLEREVVKSSAVRTAQSLFSRELSQLGIETDYAGLAKHQDIVDAVLLGAYALGRLEQAKHTEESIDCLFEERSRKRRFLS